MDEMSGEKSNFSVYDTALAVAQVILGGSLPKSSAANPGKQAPEDTPGISMEDDEILKAQYHKDKPAVLIYPTHTAECYLAR